MYLKGLEMKTADQKYWIRAHFRTKSTWATEQSSRVPIIIIGSGNLFLYFVVEIIFFSAPVLANVNSVSVYETEMIRLKYDSIFNACVCLNLNCII